MARKEEILQRKPEINWWSFLSLVLQENINMANARQYYSQPTPTPPLPTSSSSSSSSSPCEQRQSSEANYNKAASQHLLKENGCYLVFSSFLCCCCCLEQIHQHKTESQCHFVKTTKKENLSLFVAKNKGFTHTHSHPYMYIYTTSERRKLWFVSVLFSMPTHNTRTQGNNKNATRRRRKPNQET